MPNTEIRTEFYWWKTRTTPGISKTIRDCRVLPNAFTFCGIQLGQGPNALGSRNHLMGFWTDFSSIGLNLQILFSPDLRLDLKLDKQIFNWELWRGFNRHKVISWFGLCQCKTQINNSIITIKIKRKRTISKGCLKKH
jgi:hypothetical protein